MGLQHKIELLVYGCLILFAIGYLMHQQIFEWQLRRKFQRLMRDNDLHSVYISVHFEKNKRKFTVHKGDKK